MEAISIKDIKDYKNTAHKIFCGAESYLLTNSFAFNYSVGLLSEKAPVYTKNPVEASKANIEKTVYYKYYGYYVNSVSITTQAFALELYLKCLRYIEVNDFTFGHVLIELFEKLSEENKNKIIIIYKELLNRDVSMIEIEKQFGASMEIETDFHVLLKSASKAFVEYRYLFELDPKENGYFNISNHIFSVRKLILELRPEWPSLIPNFP